MKNKTVIYVLIIGCLAFLFFNDLKAKSNIKGKIAQKPLYIDPIYNGAADPVIIWNPLEKKWFMLYTNRRANIDSSKGVEWVHGTRIGIAESVDNGATWQYKDTCNIQYHKGDDTHWAPEVIKGEDGIFHMYLTYVPGIFNDWKHPRNILHLTSDNLIDWKYESTLNLATNKVIDACVFKMKDGNYRMWYNNEKDRKSIYYADSPDLYKWEDKGKAIGDKPGEGPKVFEWKEKYWMIVDNWKGLGLYKSDDLINWTRQEENLLEKPGVGKDDMTKGHHADVVVNKNRAYVFYFTHPGRTKENEKKDGYGQRRSSIQVVELEYENGIIICDRDKPTIINLKPPKN